MNFNYQKQEYPLEFLKEQASKFPNGWAARELALNGYTDASPSDAGEEPRINPWNH